MERCINPGRDHRKAIAAVIILCCLTASGCTVTMNTRTSVAPGYTDQPASIFVVDAAPNLNKYLAGAGRRTASLLARELNARGVTAWHYAHDSLDLARTSLVDSLAACRPDAVLVLRENLGVLGKSWGQTTVKEFELESSLHLPATDEVVWRARTTYEVSGQPSQRGTYLKLSEQILEKLVEDGIIPAVPAP